jgi:hypothetical protein
MITIDWDIVWTATPFLLLAELGVAWVYLLRSRYWVFAFVPTLPAMWIMLGPTNASKPFAGWPKRRRDPRPAGPNSEPGL